jgi:hypothetical protein
MWGFFLLPYPVRWANLAPDAPVFSLAQRQEVPANLGLPS